MGNSHRSPPRPKLEALLDRTEDLELDFKRELRGLHGEDLVAFANTPGGGVILVGVTEETTDDGRQTARVIGCRVGDNEKLQIVNKAQECIPSIHIEVLDEEYGDRKLFRIEIPPSPVRPHCTAAGAYKVRADGRNRALRPDEIVAILLERESESFRARFSEATATLARTLDGLVSELQGIEANLESQLQSISSSAGDASSEASDASWTLRSLEDSVTSLQRSALSSGRSLAQVHERLAYLLQAGGVSDPVADHAKAALKDEIVKYLQENPEVAAQWATATAVQLTSVHAAKLTSEQRSEAVTTAFAEFHEGKMRRPTVERAPKKKASPKTGKARRRKGT